MSAPTRGREVGQIFQKAVQVREILLRQSPSQKSEISDSPLYTRGPLGAEENGDVGGLSKRVAYTQIRAVLPPAFCLVTTICLSMRSFSSVTWEMMPTRRLPSVRPARVA